MIFASYSVSSKMSGSGLNVTVVPVSWRDTLSGAPRPRYSVLANRRLKALGLDRMQPIDVALQGYLKAREDISVPESAAVTSA